MAFNRFWYNPNSPYHNIGSATAADSVGDSFQLRYIPQQSSSQYYTSPIYRPVPTTDHQNYGAGLSQDAIRKIEELNRLMKKYRNYHINPDGIIQWAIHSCINGDIRFLDEKL